MNIGIRKRVVLSVGAALLVLGIVASSALATHARPSSATPFRVPLVTAMKQCTSATGDPAGMLHGGTLAFPSCQVGSPGTIGGPMSTNISVGSPGSVAPAPAQGGGYVLLCTSTGCGTTFAGGNGVPATPCPSTPAKQYAATCTPLPAGGGDVEIESVGLDVRCTGSTACSAPGSNGAQTTRDYIGDVRGSATIRITDHNNGSACPPTCLTSATVADLPFTVDGSCAENPGVGSAGAPIGGTCSTHTTANTAVPGAAVPWQAGQRRDRRVRRRQHRRHRRLRRRSRRQRHEHPRRAQPALRASGNPDSVERSSKIQES